MKSNQFVKSLVNRVAGNISPEPAQSEHGERISRALLIEALEPRVLFSGAPVAAPVEAPAAAPAAEAAPAAQAAPAPVAVPAEAAAPVAASEEVTVVAAPEANVEVPAPAGETSGPATTSISLTQEEVVAVAEAAAQRWINSGISEVQRVALSNISYSIADLEGSYIGSTQGSLVTLDVDAAGRGWFVDSTPFADEEYSPNGVTLDTIQDGVASGIDLLSVILHEQGHTLGLEQSAISGDIMFGIFSVGERRLPVVGQAEGALAGSLEGVHFALVVEEQFIIDANNYADGATIDGVSADSTTGFESSDAWTTSDGLAATVNAFTRSGGLSYTDTNGNVLDTAGGHLDHFRDSGAGGFSKTFTRVTTNATTQQAPGDEVWFSLLLNIDNASITGADESFFLWDHDLGGATRNFGVGFDGSSNLFVIPKNGGGRVDTGLTLQPGTNLVVARITHNMAFVDGSGNAGDDGFELFLNPTLDAAPSGVADYRIDGNFGLVGGNAGFGFDGMVTTFDLTAGDHVLYDEFRLGDTFADVTPFTAPAGTSVIITPSSATSTSTIGSGSRTIDKTIDGSGLSSGGASADILSETHSPNNGNTGLYWLSASGAPSNNEVLTFTLSGPSDIDSIHHWIYTRTGETDRGLKSFDISFSTDGGTTFPTTINAATLGDFSGPPAVTDLGPQTKTFALQTGVTHIRLSNLVNFGDPNYIGLSEIRFGGPTPPAPPAVALAFDPFLTGSNPANGEYASGGITGTNPTIDGFNGPWKGATGTWKISATGLTHDAIIDEAGGSAEFSHTSNFGGDRSAQRALTVPPSNSESEVWIAGLVQLVTTDADNLGYAYAGFGQGTWGNNGPITGETEGLLFGIQGDGSEMDLVFRHRTGAGVMTSDVLLNGLSAGDTQLVVMKVTANSIIGGTNGNDAVSIWVNPTDVNSEAAMGTAMMFEDFSVQANSTAFTDLMLGGNSGLFGGIRFDELAIGNSLDAVVKAAGTTTVKIDSGNLVIEDTGGGNSDDAIQIVFDGTNYRIIDPTNSLGAGAGATLDGADILVAASGITGSIIVNTFGGDDTLTLDLTTPFANAVVFNGGTQNTAAGDALVVIGAGGTTHTYNYDAPGAPDGFGGNLDLGGTVITYTGLEPITVGGTATDVIINLPAGADAATLTDNGTTLTLSGGTFETTTFNQPAAGGSLTISGGTDDTLTLGGTLTMDGVDFTVDNIATTLASSVNLTRGGGDLTFNGNLTQGAGNVTLSANDITLNGTTTLQTGQSNAFQLNAAGALTNMAGKLFDLNGGRLQLINGTEVINDGTMETGDNTQGPIFATNHTGNKVTNNGTFLHNSDQLRLYVELTNTATGTLIINNPGGKSDVQLQPTSVNGPGGVIRNQGIMTVSDDDVRFELAGSLINEGNGTMTFNGGGLTEMAAATMNVTGGTVNITNGTNFQNRSISTTTLSGGTVNVTTGATVQNVSGGVLQFGGSAVNINSGTSLTNEAGGTLNLIGGTYTVGLNGTLTNAGTATWLDGNDGNKTISGSGTIVNSGTFDHNLQGGNDNLVLTGTVTFQNDGVFSFNHQGDIDLESGAEFVNAGTLQKTVAGGDPSFVFTFGTTGGTFTQTATGIVRSDAGRLRIATENASSDAAGTWNANGGDIELAGEWTGTLSGTATGAGQILVTDSSNGAVMSDFSAGAGGVTFDIGGNGFVWVNSEIDTSLGDVTNSNTMEIIAGGTKLLTGGGSLITANGGTTTITSSAAVTSTGGSEFQIDGGGTLQGSGTITAIIDGKAGSNIITQGDLSLGDAAANAFATLGNIIVNSGDTLTANDSGLALLGESTLVDGTLTKGGGAAGFSLAGGETISGSGIVNGNVTTNTGTIAPGTSPGILTVNGNVDLGNGNFDVEINGTAAGSGYDQLIVNGTVDLDTGADLNISLGFEPTAGQTFTIIDNDLADAVMGEFAGLADGTILGAVFSGEGFLFKINYSGGDGNDVVLTSLGSGYVWDGGGTDNNWSTPGNWVGDVAPDDSGDAWDTFVFAGTTRLTPVADIAAAGGVNVNEIIFNSDAGAFTLTGDSLDMLGANSSGATDGVAKITNNSANTQTINQTLIHRSDFNTGLEFNAAAGDIVINGIIQNGNASDPVTVAGTNTVTFSGSGKTYISPTVVGGGVSDDFESYVVGLVRDNAPANTVWDTNGSGLVHIESQSGNQFLSFGWNSNQSRGAHRSLGGGSVADGSIGNVSFDVRVDSGEGESYYGVTDAAPTAGQTQSRLLGSNLRAFVGLVDNPADGTVDLVASDGTAGGQLVLQAGLSVNTWYAIEMVIDNGNSTYDVFLDGSQVGTDIAFRGGALSADLDHFVVIGKGQDSGASGGVNLAGHLDNLVSSSESTLLINTNHTSAGSYTVNVGSTLGGTGTITLAGTNTVTVDGILATGDPATAGGVGTLNVTGEVTLADTSRFDFDIDGANADNLNLMGGITLGGIFNPNVISDPTAQIITVVANDGTDQITTAFSNLAEGDTLMLGAKEYRIFYNGGDGNDVVLVDTGKIVTISNFEYVTVSKADTDGDDSPADAGQFAGPLYVRERQGANNSPALQVEAFLRFDLTGEQGTLTGANLFLHENHKLNAVNTANLFIAQVTEDWAVTDNTTTTNQPVMSENAGATGVTGEFVVGSIGAATAGPVVDIDHNIDVTTFAQDWLDNPADNFGVRLRLEDLFVGAAFDDTGADAPLLTLTYAAPGLLYVNDQWAGLNNGVLVDGDLETAGSQDAVMGVDAFSSIADALAAYTNYGDTILVNGGSYASADLAGGGDVTLQLVRDLTNGENDVTVNLLSGSAGDNIETAHFGNAGNLIVNTAQQNTTSTFNGTISGSGGLTMADAGFLFLGGANTFTGVTAIDMGLIQLTNVNALQNTSLITVAAGATLDLAASGGGNYPTAPIQIAGDGLGNRGALRVWNGANVQGDITLTGDASINAYVSAGTVSGAIGGTGNLSLNKSQANAGGVLTITGTSANTYVGTTTTGAVNNGTVVFDKTDDVDAVGGDVIVAGGTLRFDGSEQIGDGATLTQNGGTIALNDRTETITDYVKNNGNISTGGSGLLVITGTFTGAGGTMDVNSNNGYVVADSIVYTGGSINIGQGGGTLEIGPGGLMIGGVSINLDNNLASVLLNGDVTTLGSATTAKVEERNGTNFASGGGLNLGGAVRTFTVVDGAAADDLDIGVVTFNGGITKAGDGTMVLSTDQANTYTGKTTVEAGTLALRDAGTIDDSSEIAVTGGAFFDITGLAGGGYNFGNEVTGGGTAVGNLGITSGGALRVGENSGADIGDFDITGNFTGNMGATLELGLVGTAGAGMAGGHDQLIVGGDVALGGMTLSLTSTGFTSMANQTFTLVRNDGVNAVSGTFDGLAEGAIIDDVGNQNVYTISYVGGDGNDVVLNALGPAETGGTLEMGDLVIEDIGDGDTDPGTSSSTDDRLTVSVTTDSTGAPALRIHDPNQLLGVDFAGAERPDIHTIIVPFSVFDDLIIRSNGGDDIVNFGDLTGYDQSITVEQGDGFDLINFSGNASGAAGESYDLNAERVRFLVGSSIAATGAGNITVNGTGGGTGTGEFGFIYEGVKLKDADLSSVDGDITVTGQGGDDAAGNEGIQLSAGSSIMATGTGSVTLAGQGGTGGSSNTGVSLIEGSTVSSGAAGGVTVTGTGGGERDSQGVNILHGSTVSGGAGGVMITGTADGTGVRNDGVYTTSSTISASDGGSVTITGTASQSAASGANAIGVRISSGTTVDVADGGGITLTGTGGTGTSGNEGVHIGQNSALGTEAGDITITGTSSATGANNYGVHFLGGSSAMSGGALTVMGTGGNGNYGNAGVSLLSTTLTSATTLSVTGTGQGTGWYNHGIIGSGSTVTGGTGVALVGTGSQNSTTGYNDGVSLSGTSVTATGGTLAMTGIGGTGGSANNGVKVTNGSLSGTLDIDGTGGGGAGGNSNAGVKIAYADLTGVTGGTIDGTGGMGSFYNYGAVLYGNTGGSAATATGTAGQGAASDATAGDYFNFLPALLAVAAAEKRSRKQVLGGLMKRISENSEIETGIAGVQIYREEDGLVGLDPTLANLESLEEAGIAIPAAPKGTRAVILLTGDGHGPLAGFVANVDASGELVSSETIEAPASLTAAALLAQLTGEDQPLWSSPIHGALHRTNLSEVFGL